jgi:hypothetical protein
LIACENFLAGVGDGSETDSKNDEAITAAYFTATGLPAIYRCPLRSVVGVEAGWVDSLAVVPCFLL